MSGKKKVVRRQTLPKKGKTKSTRQGKRGNNDVKRFAHKSPSKPRAKSVARTRPKGGSKTQAKRHKRAGKTPLRKHAPRKQGKTRKLAKRPELLLKKKKRATPPAKRAKKTSNRQRQRQKIRRIFDGDEGEEDGGFIVGPAGNSFDEDFADINWSDVDWDDIIDDFGDEEEDSYGEEAK